MVVPVVLGLHELQVAPRLRGARGRPALEAAGSGKDVPPFDRREPLGVRLEQVNVGGRGELKRERLERGARTDDPISFDVLVVLGVVAVVSDRGRVWRGGEGEGLEAVHHSGK